MNAEARMRDTAIGRVQIAADVRLRATEHLVAALRAAHRAGATVEQLAIEAGLPDAIVRKVTRGRGLGDLILDLEDVA